MIFDIKLEGSFTRKARSLADSHTTGIRARILASSVDENYIPIGIPS